MTSVPKRIVYVERLASAAFSDVIAERRDVVLARLPRSAPDANMFQLLSNAHAYQVSSARDDVQPRHVVTASLLQRAPDLLLVSAGGAGYDTIDVAACTQAGVLAVNQAGGNREAVAEHALGMMICLSKRIAEVNLAMRREQCTSREAFMGHDLLGKTVGIIGLGETGSRLAELCRAFRMRVLACDPHLTAEQVLSRGGEKTSLDALLSRSDFVSLNCPLSAQTRGMIGRAEFALMRPHVYFVSTARGGVHDEAALAEALERGGIAGAGIDVWEKEPPPPDHPLLKFDNVLASPHTAGVTHEARSHIGAIAARQIIDVLDGKRPPRLLNPEAWPAFVERYETMLGLRAER